MALTAQDVHDKQFRLVRQSTGYDIDEVDAFLDEVEAEIGRLHDELAAAREQLAAQPPPQQDAATSGGSAARILELAQRTADEYVAEARRTADSLVSEAEERARSAVAGLESQRGELEARVAALRAFEGEVRGRLTSYFEGQLRDLRAIAERPADPQA
ncbi:MAG: DivIVA domain-containing protein [Candidatus Nanopelagicales bacterium]|jgi:DivIVA domain-containing protein|nr:DivIVA domain-containing protein [Candidatus Nanopelagicales bacterium]